MGAFDTNSSGDDTISGINITPLVDVILVLLIIFMITAPVIYQSAIQLQLPKAATGDKSNPSPLSFHLTKDGHLHWQKEALDWNALDQKLTHLSEVQKNETAVINADQETSHGTVIRLIDALRQAGILRFALNVDSVPTAKHESAPD